MTAAPTRWTVDPENTSVDFAVKTFWGLMTVRGRFDRFEGSYEIGPHGPKIELTVDAGSIDTGNRKRDEHLRSADFFDVEQHPQVRFTSTRVRPAGDGMDVEGVLEAAGEVMPIKLFTTVHQVGEARQVEATTTVDHSLLGMSSGHFGMIRRPATLHVKARLNGVRELDAEPGV
jgi:polyisoprenoid-binding protein YceI